MLSNNNEAVLASKLWVYYCKFAIIKNTPKKGSSREAGAKKKEKKIANQNTTFLSMTIKKKNFFWHKN